MLGCDYRSTKFVNRDTRYVTTKITNHAIIKPFYNGQVFTSNKKCFVINRIPCILFLCIRLVLFVDFSKVTGAEMTL